MSCCLAPHMLASSLWRKRGLLLESRTDLLGPDGVAPLARMEPVGAVEASVGQAVCIEQAVGQIDGSQQRIGEHALFDQPVRLLGDRPQLPARAGWGDAHVEDERPGQRCMDPRDEGIEPLGDVLGRRRVWFCDVVGAGEEHDRRRAVGRTIRSAERTTSSIIAPPKPRLITLKGAMSRSRVDHSVKLELPVKTIPPAAGGRLRSAASNLRILPSQGSGRPSSERAMPTASSSPRSMERMKSTGPPDDQADSPAPVPRSIPVSSRTSASLNMSMAKRTS